MSSTLGDKTNLFKPSLASLLQQSLNTLTVHFNRNIYTAVQSPTHVAETQELKLNVLHLINAAKYLGNVWLFSQQQYRACSKLRHTL